MNDHGAAAMSGMRERRGSGRCWGGVVLAIVLTVLGVGCSGDQPTLGDPVVVDSPEQGAAEPAQGAAEPAQGVEEPAQGAEEPAQRVDAPVTSDGVTLAFDRYGEGTRAVVLAHQRGSDRASWAPFAETLAAAGYLVVAPDFRGYGESPGDKDVSPELDLIAAVEWATAKGAEDVVIIGASMGGTAAVTVATEVGAIGVVSLSSPSTFAGLDALAAARGLTIPTLFFAAEDDEPYVDETSAQAAAAGDEVQVFSGGAHGTALLTAHGDAIEGQILAFLANI